MKTEAFIGIGSNLGLPLEQVRAAIDALSALEKTQLVSVSPLYRTAPIGPQNQPDYVNAVALIETHFEPHDLLSELQKIEQQQGRMRGERWGARTLDLDLLIYGESVISDDTLQIPHPRMAERAFVLYPLSNLAPQLLIPGLGQVNELLDRVQHQSIEEIPNLTL